MTDDMMSLRTLLEKSADADLLREMIGFAAYPFAKVLNATWQRCRVHFMRNVLVMRNVLAHAGKQGRLDGAESDVLAYRSLPPAHRLKPHSTNPIERLNGEIKRRTEVVGILQPFQHRQIWITIRAVRKDNYAFTAELKQTTEGRYRGASITELRPYFFDTNGGQERIANRGRLRR